MIQRLGADAVSMSTVNEALFAHHLGLRVAAVSLISNAAAGLGAQTLTHEEVLEAGVQGQDAFRALLSAYVDLLADSA